ncbi:MAG: cysteine desulfurase [Candidatus Sumerlaeia bacterium]|nr:cysteine desulfurase [Candidatus Sumerlaeia bacterium]
MDIYCDHCATTPLDPRVEQAMQPYWREKFGNPSSLHRAGQRGRAAVEQARRAVARAIGAQPDEIVFTASATEANNLAIRGCLAAAQKRPIHIITSCIEHACVIETCRLVERCEPDCTTTVVPCGPDGVVNVADVLAAVRPETVLVALMHVNNETGMVQPVMELARALRGRGVRLLCDVAQSPGRVPLSVGELGCDYLTLSSHKIYGPPGVGALCVRTGAPLEPMIVGGGQERGLRAGTENVPGIVGFAAALELAVREQSARRAHLQQCEAAFLNALERARVPYSLNGAPAPRAAGILNLSFAGFTGYDLVIALDLEGIAVSAGSACAAGVPEPSRVLEGMRLGPDRVRGAVRFSFGMSNTPDQCRCVAECVADILCRRPGRTAMR